MARASPELMGWAAWVVFAKRLLLWFGGLDSLFLVSLLFSSLILQFPFTL